MRVSLNIYRLKECRERLGISKMEAAKRMQLSQPAYLRYEAGTRIPSLQTMTVIANVLNTSVEYLTDQSDDPMPVSYTISKTADPELFEIINICKMSNDNMIKRLSTNQSNEVRSQDARKSRYPSEYLPKKPRTIDFKRSHGLLRSYSISSHDTLY